MLEDVCPLSVSVVLNSPTIGINECPESIDEGEYPACELAVVEFFSAVPIEELLIKAAFSRMENGVATDTFGTKKFPFLG